MYLSLRRSKGIVPGVIVTLCELCVVRGRRHRQNERRRFFPLCVVALTFTVSSPFAAPVDVLRTLGLSEDMEGVSQGDGLCKKRGGQQPDLAYRIDKKIQLSAPTKQLFPGRGFQFSCGIVEILDSFQK